MQALISCFLSLVIAGVPCTNEMTRAISQPKIESYAQNISTSELEIGMTKNGIIGRHEMVQIKSFEYIGLQSIKDISDMYNADVLTNFTFSETVTTITSSTVSTVGRYNSQVTSGLQVSAGIKGTSISNSATVIDAYTIENSYTYSTSTTRQFTVQYDIREEAVRGKKYCLCQAAYVFKLNCETWKWDDYWWGKREVGGSRQSFTAYYTVEPFVTIRYEDGTICDT